MWSGYAFPSPKKGAHPIDRHAITHSMAKITARVGLTDARPHDFRRTGSTNITGERIGIPRLIVSRVLDQISDTGGAAAVTGVYDRNEYLPEKRRALDDWAGLIDQTVTGVDRPRNVIPLAGKIILQSICPDTRYVYMQHTETILCISTNPLRSVWRENGSRLPNAERPPPRQPDPIQFEPR